MRCSASLEIPSATSSSAELLVSFETFERKLVLLLCLRSRAAWASVFVPPPRTTRLRGWDTSEERLREGLGVGFFDSVQLQGLVSFPLWHLSLCYVRMRLCLVARVRGRGVSRESGTGGGGGGVELLWIRVGRKGRRGGRGKW